LHQHPDPPVQLIKNLLSDTIHLFYPHLCTGCGSDLLHKHHLLCLKCINRLPHTYFARYPGNPVEKYFWGRLNIVAAHSEFYFAKDAIIQHLIHQLKYKGNTAIGHYLGELLGDTLLKSGRFSTIDRIVPLPLYPDKEHKRGYNQAAIIAQGISVIMNIPVLNGNVIRQRSTATQTLKHRDERWENVDRSFTVKDAAAIKHKHLLLVDDVVTTGATLEACGSVMMREANCSLSIATLAHASK
jgi:ComF family protein